MKKLDKDWANSKISTILKTPFADIMGNDPRDKLRPPRIKNHVDDAYSYFKGIPQNQIRKRNKAPLDELQMQLFAEYLARELKRQKKTDQ